MQSIRKEWEHLPCLITCHVKTLLNLKTARCLRQTDHLICLEITKICLYNSIFLMYVLNGFKNQAHFGLLCFMPRHIFRMKDWACDPIFLDIYSSWVKRSLHANFQLHRLPGNGSSMVVETKNT